MRTILTLCFLNLTLISCGKHIEIFSDDQIHIFGPEEMTCKVIVYPMWQRNCDSQHVQCTTLSNGKTECLIHFTGRELDNKLDN